MAKKDKDALYKSFLADLLAAVPADKRDVIKETLESEGVSKVASERVLAREDYSRFMDEGRAALASTREALDAEVAEARTKIDGWNEWYGTASTEFATTSEQLKRYRAEFGDLEGTGTGNNGKRADLLTKAEAAELLQKTLNERDAFAIDMSVMLADLGEDHREKLGSRLDRKALIDFATKNNLRLDVAYDRMIAPKLHEKQQADFDKQLASAKLEGAREERSKHNLPVLASATESYTPSWQKGETNLVSRNSGERVGAAVDDFNALLGSRG